MKHVFSSLLSKTLALAALGMYVCAHPLQALAAANDAIGTIDKPDAIKNIDAKGGISGEEIGILFFGSQIITYITIIAGIWTLANLFLAGFLYISSSGNSQVHTQVRDKITMSVMGLVLIVTVYAVGAIIGTVFFGNSQYLLNPTL